MFFKKLYPKHKYLYKIENHTNSKLDITITLSDEVWSFKYDTILKTLDLDTTNRSYVYGSDHEIIYLHINEDLNDGYYNPYCFMLDSNYRTLYITKELLSRYNTRKKKNKKKK